MIKFDDQGDCFRVPLDARSLQFEEGEHGTAKLRDYTSANTERLGVRAIRHGNLSMDHDAYPRGSLPSMFPEAGS